MHRSKIQTTKPELSFTVSADWLRCRLRADAIRQSLILALAREWAEAETNVTAALDQLAAVQAGDPTAEALNTAVAAVEACTDDALAIEIGLPDLLRMRTEMDAVIAKLTARSGTADVRHMAPKQVSA